MARGTSLFGWCLPGSRHSDCIVVIHWPKETFCACVCHKPKSLRGRPRKNSAE